MVESRPGGGAMSYDALMRWEWEGGAPPSASGQGEDVRVEPAHGTQPPPAQSQPLRSRTSWFRLRRQQR